MISAGASVETAGRQAALDTAPTPLTLGPTTYDDLVDELRAAGLEAGDVVLVHSSLRSLGFVVGGAQAVCSALVEVVGSTGTVVVPTHSPSWSEPTHWEGRMPEEWCETIRAAMPAYHPRLTPTAKMGAVVECLRRWPGFARSWHPRVSFGAVGPHAEGLLGGHVLGAGFGDRSPVGRLYELGGRILLLGVGHDRSSALHLAEHRAHWPDKRWITQGAAITVEGARRWVEWRELDHDASDFERIGGAVAAAGLEQVSWVGCARTRLMPAREVVDLATDWIAVNR